MATEAGDSAHPVLRGIHSGEGSGDEPCADSQRRLDDPHREGPVVLRSACSNRDAFLAHRERLVDLVVRMGEDLDQADVFILAYDSDSLLIEVAERTH